MQVLVVDDAPAVRTAVQVLLETHGIECLEAASPAEALALVASHDVGVVIQDMNFSKDTTSGEEGIELFRALRRLDPDLSVILMTAWTELETAVQMVREGVADYLEKPWNDDKLALGVKNLLALAEARCENLGLRGHDERARAELERRYDLCGLVYRSRGLHEVVSLAVRVAASDAPVLVSGPNGSGKDCLAKIVQKNSRRAAAPFVVVNAGGLPDQLLEAELFGAEPGAYTGASQRRIGRFEAAEGGTLFLDELGNLSASGQAKLLRVLESGEFQRLGSNVTRRANVRLISATNANLRDAIARGRFREDLYFRLNVIELEVPALSARRQDVLPLAEHFLARHAPGRGLAFGAAARSALLEHDWPGNVRELSNRVRRAALVATGAELDPRALGLDPLPDRPAPDPDAPPGQSSMPPTTLGAAERELIEAALARHAGVVARAAAELGLSRQALYRRMQRLEVHPERRVVFPR